MTDFLVLETSYARGAAGPVTLEAGRVISDALFDVTALSAQGVALVVYVPAIMADIVEAFRRQTSRPGTTDTDLTALLVASNVLGASLPTKSGVVLAASFAGNPKVATVTFGFAFSSAAYAVTLGIHATGASFSPRFDTKAATGFVINMGANNIVGLNQMEWHAILVGEI